MTTLIVKPIDADAPGSFRKFQRLAAALAAAEQAQGSATSFTAVVDIVLAQSETDDDTPVEDALDELSLNEFAGLLRGLADSSVPTQSAAN